MPRDLLTERGRGRPTTRTRLGNVAVPKGEGLLTELCTGLETVRVAALPMVQSLPNVLTL